MEVEPWISWKYNVHWKWYVLLFCEAKCEAKFFNECLVLADLRIYVYMAKKINTTNRILHNVRRVNSSDHENVFFQTSTKFYTLGNIWFHSTCMSLFIMENLCLYVPCEGWYSLNIVYPFIFSYLTMANQTTDGYDVLCTV